MFYSEKFIFDETESDMMDIILVTTSKTDILNDIGTVFSETIKAENTRTDNPYYILDSKSSEVLTLEFAYVDLKDYSAKAWDEEKLDEVISWLYTEDFKPFISYDNDEITYYLKATKIYKKFNAEMKGMLEIEFQPYTSYGYKTFYKKSKVDTEAEVKVINESTNSNPYYEPIIEIKSLDGKEVSIQNLSVLGDEPLVVKGFNTNEKIIIDNSTYSVENEKGENKFLNVNRNWIRLRKGKNILKIKGNCEVEIKCNFPKIV